MIQYLVLNGGISLCSVIKTHKSLTAILNNTMRSYIKTTNMNKISM